ncbi:hypothetical protein FLONG3_128 [Fusarium longipes]|uniref:F-box domain-containing protein n=1 Tax=Fusarium longipes TaxID=694270 RepID=A0A395TAP8_9HYPO|nr:hypothetical protein FLONG3_128 [Fusarium longipes]
MAARRSARLKAKADEPAPSEVPSQEPKRAPKRKAPTSHDDKRVKKAPKTKSPTKKAHNKSTDQKSKSKSQSASNKTGKSSAKVASDVTTNSPNGPFSSLPPEVMDMIMEKFEDKASLGNLSKTSKAFHSLVMPRLYKRVEGSPHFHAHIAKHIRSIEPILTIEQRKQLKKEGKYRGQQEDFPDQADEKKRPEIADFVRQVIFQIGDPGRKHRFIVYRYIEELLGSVNNLEVFAASDITELIANRLADKEHLQALWLQVSNERADDAKALITIKGLKHLRLQTAFFYKTEDIPLNLIWNSRSTLRSLDVNRGFFQSIYQKLGVEQEGEQDYKFTALKSLTLRTTTMDPDEVDALIRSIDFTALEELKLGYKNVRTHLLYQRLNDIFAAKRSDIKLRKLSLYLGSQSMSNLDRMTANPEEEEPGIEFLSTFDTLTSLTIYDTDVHSWDLPDRGLKDNLLQGIFKHTNLTSLEFKDSISIQGWKMPTLDPQMVKRFLKAFPKLRHFRLHPQPKQLNEIAEALSEGRNLETISIQMPRLSTTDKEKEVEFLRHLVTPILERDPDIDTKDYRWEHHSKLHRLTIDVEEWDIGSDLGKAKKGLKKAEYFTASSNPKRKVMYRDVTNFNRVWLRGSLDEMCDWAERASKDFD